MAFGGMKFQAHNGGSIPLTRSTHFDLRDPVALTLTIVSEFDAPAERVWQVWADPRQLERWWGPPTHPATVVDHDLTRGGRVTYYMTGPDGEKYHSWWRIISVDPPRSLEFEDGFADDSGRANGELPTTSVEVRLITAAPDTTTMTITSRFASTADMEQLIAMGQDEGMTLAVGQIDAILATPISGR
jgi:uncharacterized protein YndB with AHSA1/START domain